ncbi:MAG: trimethylamine methyltransferase family protein [Anaerolineae bacterium]|nr:trimethylamine methyltransferase family protein [Anaerolineae bacterium]
MVRRRERKTRERGEETAVSRATQPLHHLPPYEILNEEGLQKIHDASMTILSEIGIDFYDAEAQAVLRANGVRLEGDTAYFDPAQVMETIAQAPAKFTQIARNPANNVLIGGQHLAPRLRPALCA